MELYLKLKDKFHVFLWECNCLHTAKMQDRYMSHFNNNYNPLGPVSKITTVKLQHCY